MYGYYTIDLRHILGSSNGIDDGCESQFCGFDDPLDGGTWREDRAVASLGVVDGGRVLGLRLGCQDSSRGGHQESEGLTQRS